MSEEIKGRCCKEVLAHFNCDSCNKWWTIGDAPDNKAEWFCPWCGEKQKEKKI